MMKSRRAISPVIATVLLVVIAIALFVMIFLWIKSIQKEVILKGGSAIELSCQSISFDVVKQGSEIQIQNRGTVTIGKAQVTTISSGRSSSREIAGVIMAGDSTTVSDIGTCTQIKVTPFLIGVLRGTNTEKYYMCKEQAKTVNC